MNKARDLTLLSTSSSSSSESDGEGRRVVSEEPPLTWSASGNNRKKRLSKQLSMRETTREAAWEKRRLQILQRQRRRTPQLMVPTTDDECEEAEEEEDDSDCYTPGKRLLARARSLTDEDLFELRGSIELGFGFTEDGGHDLCHTLPALDLYFAVNRQLSDPRIHFSPSPASTPTTIGGGSSSSVIDTPSPRSPNHPHAAANAAAADSPPWKICSPGDNPQHVKTRLRHWAQAVACSVLLKEWNGGAGAASAGDE